jgi:hypothetical protein
VLIQSHWPGKRHLESPTAALKVMGCDEAEWKEQLNAVRCGWRVVGGSGKKCGNLRRRLGSFGSSDPVGGLAKQCRRARTADRLI